MTEVHVNHRATFEKILRHLASGNIEWREVKPLLDAVGATTEEHNGKLKVTPCAAKPRCWNRRAERTSTHR